MYHPRVVEAKINRALAAGACTYRNCAGVYVPFYPERHSISECEANAKLLDDLRDAESGELQRPLDDAERAWIANELFLCRVDYDYWQTRYVWVMNEQGRVVRFKPRIAQQIIGDMMAENELLNIGILFQVLKARQLGLSRDTENRVSHRVLFYSNTNAVIASSDPEKSRKLANMLEFVVYGGSRETVGDKTGGLPWWMIPKTTARRVGEFIEYGQQNSAITISHGRQFNGIARGDTPQIVHLSELCDFIDPEELVDGSLLRAMHDSPWLFLVLESTALGRGNWWHKTWLSSKEGWPEGRSRLRPVFLPWFVGTDLYPTPTWLRARPVPPRYIPKPEVDLHARKAKQFVRHNDLLRKYLGEDWEMPVEQKWFYEVEYEEAKRKGNLNKFLAEMPSSDDEAFQSTNYSVFDIDTIRYYRDTAHAQEPIGVYGIQGQEHEIPLRLQPAANQVDPNKKPVDVTCSWGNAFPSQYRLVPLKWNGYSSDQGLGKIFIWEWPDLKETYGFGVDTSDGVGKDRSVIQGLRKGSLFRKPAQILEYANPYINAHDLWPICMALGTLFSTPQDGILKQPRMAIECRGNGDTVQHELLKRGWSNFHKWARIDNRRPNLANANKIGVFTNVWFRAQMMDWILKFLRDQELDINSPYFVGEMESLEGDETVQKLKAGYGEHDDRILAMGFVLVSLYQWELLNGRNPMAVHQRDKLDEHPRYKPSWQAREVEGEDLRPFLGRNY